MMPHKARAYQISRVRLTRGEKNCVGRKSVCVFVEVTPDRMTPEGPVVKIEAAKKRGEERLGGGVSKPASVRRKPDNGEVVALNIHYRGGRHLEVPGGLLKHEKDKAETPYLSCLGPGLSWQRDQRFAAEAHVASRRDLPQEGASTSVAGRAKPTGTTVERSDQTRSGRFMAKNQGIRGNEEKGVRIQALQGNQSGDASAAVRTVVEAPKGID